MPRLIAIDLGAHAVKVSTYRVQGRKYLFEDRFRVPVPQDGDMPGLESRLVALDALLGDHPELAGGGSDTVALVVPGELATFHRMSLPFQDKAQIEKTLPFAVEGEVPFDLDDMVLGWRVLSGLKSNVLAVMVRHDRLSSWIAELAERRLDPAVVYVDAEVLGHYGQSAPVGPALDEESGEERRPAVVVLDIGHSHTLISVVVGGTVVFSRAANVGGYAFTQAIQGALGCTWQEAEARKHGTWTEDPADAQEEPTDPGDDLAPNRTKKATSGYAALPPPARAAVDGAIGLLLAELRATLIEAEDSLDVGVEEVRVTGGSARIAELWDYIAADLGVPVRRCGEGDADSGPIGFQLSHALAMLASGQTRTQAIDLRIGDLEYRGGTDLLRVALVYGSAGLAFFTVAALLMFVVQFRSLSVEQNQAEAQIRQILGQSFEGAPTHINDTESAVALARGLRDDAVQRAEILSRGGGGVPPTIDTLAALTSAFPPHPNIKVDVDQLTITPAQISFEAETDGFVSSAQVEEQLQGSSRFKNAIKGQETRLGNGRVKFPITIPLGDYDGEEG